jgi:hypothetical protein
MSVMNTGPFGCGVYVVKASRASRPCTIAPSRSTGNTGAVSGARRRNDTTRFAGSARANAAKGSRATSARSASTERTIEGKVRLRWRVVAASHCIASTSRGASGAENNTLPLASTVFTSRKPARSKAAASSVIVQLVGYTPRSSAA